MNRDPFQTLVIPYRILPNQNILYAIFRCEERTGGYWQGIAGGGENGESPLEAAKREAFEEAGIGEDSDYIALDSLAMIPVKDVCGFKWGEDVLVIPEYCFGIKVENEHLQLSPEHTDFRWMNYSDAKELLHWDSNKTALWELNHRLGRIHTEQ